MAGNFKIDLSAKSNISPMIAIIIGLGSITSSLHLLSRSEGGAVAQSQNLAEGRQLVISISSNNSDPANNGKLVHVTGRATTTETVSDPLFHISQTGIKLKRDVKMYQWKEKIESSFFSIGHTSNRKTYSYGKEWNSQHIPSSSFEQAKGHGNYMNWQYDSQVWPANTVTLGDFTLSTTQIDQINDYTYLNVDNTTLPDPIKSRAKMFKGGYYFGDDPSSPKLGDLQIHFAVVHPVDISIIAKQVNHTFEPYHTSTGTLDLVEIGKHSADDMFTTQARHNMWETWHSRYSALLLLSIGTYLLFTPIVFIARYIPLLGFITEAAAKIISLFIAVILTLTVMVVSWYRYHPGGMVTNKIVAFLLSVGHTILSAANDFMVYLLGKL